MNLSIPHDWGIVDSLDALSLDRYGAWIHERRHADLSYLEKINERQSLRNVFPDCHSALVFAFPYPRTPGPLASFVSAFNSRDYHDVIREELTRVAHDYATGEFRVAVDTWPILERDLAFRAGLGSFGKNSLLIHPEFGSFFLIGSILFSHPLPLEKKPRLDSDPCGPCRRCIDACPTKAIGADRTIDCARCVSAFTIECREEKAPPLGYDMTDMIFGCDRCQEVCPKNARVPVADGGLLHAYFNRPLDRVVKDLDEMSNRAYREKFKGTSLARTGRIGMLKNLRPRLNR